RTKTVSDHGLQLRFIPGIDHLRKNPLRISPPSSHAPKQQRAPQGFAASLKQTTSAQAEVRAQGYRFTSAPWKLETGDIVPFFSLPSIQNGELREIHLYSGKPIVLFFVHSTTHPDLPRFRQVVGPFCAALGDSAWSISIISPDMKEHFRLKVGTAIWV